MTRVLFLDIDGVLNCQATQEMKHEVWIIDPLLVINLNKICCAVPDITVVLSSSWKYAVRSKHIDINQLLEEHGYIGPKITELTPFLDDPEDYAEYVRGDEIQAWLDLHPEVKSFVVLDDDDDMSTVQNCLVQTSFQYGGLQSKHVDLAIEMLKID